MPLTRRAAITVATALAALATGACSSGPDSAGPASPGDAVVAPVAPVAPAAPAAPAAGADWPTYHGDNARTGFSAGTPRLGTLAAAWATHLDGAVYASPVVVAGTAVVATENDSVYGLDAATGTIRWRQHLATPAPLSALPCGNVDPLGITGTPAYDAVTGRVFVVTTRLAGRRLAHELVGLDPRTGAVRLRRGADPAGQDPTVQNQRGALAVSRGVVYVPYGGHAGDCGDYHGSVVGLRADGKGSLSSYRVPTQRKAGSGPRAGSPSTRGVASTSPWATARPARTPGSGTRPMTRATRSPSCRRRCEARRSSPRRAGARRTAWTPTSARPGPC